jgi:hypothetical protein
VSQHTLTGFAVCKGAQRFVHRQPRIFRLLPKMEENNSLVLHLRQKMACQRNHLLVFK